MSARRAGMRLARPIGRACGAWYRALLAIYPRAFREANAREAANTFAAECEEDLRRGDIRRFARRIARAPLDVLRHGVAERLFASRDAWRASPKLSTSVRDILAEIHMPTLIRGHRGYALLTSSSLSLAVGATLVVFTVVNALWLRPVPVPEPDRVVIVVGTTPGEVDARLFSIDWLEQEDDWRMFDGVAGQIVTSGDQARQAAQLTIAAADGEVEALGVTSTYFAVLGQAIRGRGFTREDSQPGAEPVAVISDRFWAHAFGRRADVIGALTPAAPQPIRIVGVAPPGFEGARRGERTDVWLPATLAVRLSPKAATESDPGGAALLLARLRPGQSLDAAKQSLIQQTLSRAQWMAPADLDHYRSILESQRVVRLSEVFGSPSSRTIVVSEGRAAAVVAGLAALVLIGSCATLMALVLVHYERRRRELSVRLALGASRLRLAAQLGVEFGWLAVAGTAGAVMVAYAGLEVLPALSLTSGVDLGRLDLSPDWRVLAAAIGTTTLTLAAAAAVPLVRFTRGALASEIVAVRSTTPACSQRLRQALLALHVAATMVVLVSAGLFVRTVVRGFSDGPGFDVDRVVSVRLRLPGIQATPGLDVPTQLAVVRERMLALVDSLRALPGVDDAAVGWMPIGLERMADAQTVSEIDAGGRQWRLAVGNLRGDAGLLEALGVPVLSGRTLTPDDAAGRGRMTPVLVSASLARTFWPDDDPVGQTAQLVSGRVQIVGVVRDFAYGSMTQPAAGVFIRVFSGGGIVQPIVVRVEHPGASVESIRKTVAMMLPEVERLTIETGREIVARDLGAQRLGAWFFSGFGLIALVLGAGGVFGLVAYLAESRRREFGVRVALGATPDDLVRRGVSAGLVPVAIGAVAGLIAAALVARLFATMLPGLSPLDPLTYLGVVVLLAACATAAGLVAAWRLRSLAPIEALRAE